MLIATRTTLVCLAFGSLIIAGSPRSARANAPAPDSYWVQVTDNTVRVCVDVRTRQCPGGGELLRQDISTGAVVKLPEFCTSDGCYLDECVPAGSYRYGYAEPLECKSPSGTFFFSEAEVTTSATTCKRSPGSSEPTVYSGTLPWSSDAVRCKGTYGGGLGGCSVSRSRSDAQLGVLLIQRLALLVGMILWRRRAASR